MRGGLCSQRRCIVLGFRGSVGGLGGFQFPQLLFQLVDFANLPLQLLDLSGLLLGAGARRFALSFALLLLLVSGAVAFLTSLLSIRFLTGFIKKHTFIPFGIYRIILGVAVLMLRKG